MTDETPMPTAETPEIPQPAPISQDMIRERQRARAKVTAWLLAGFVVLIFAISIVKIAAGYA
ncbi:hypothetical protein [Sphingomonas sp.]|uniref:hypothetical protein n=1 Tax=Sphingomonas sp. TaxID=28214 RepID=UPI001B1FE330|nr:hypothetical protein [Sphingomonas sp.]MBO9713004.1 hypothetical protein [Sphingomonas sp.]